MELNKSIVVKFSELHLKGGNKKEFITTLTRNIKNKFETYSIEAQIKNLRDKIEITSDSHLDKVPAALDEVVGISLYSTVYKCKSDKDTLEELMKSVLSNLPKETKFRVSAKIVEDTLFNDKNEMIKWLAWFGTNVMNFKIDLSNYDLDLNVRLENGEATFIADKTKGIYGLPAGGNGKALTLLSGGIDSPVAAFKTITRGINTSFITFLTPRTSQTQTLSKIMDLAKQVDKYNGISGKLFLVNFERVQERIMKLEDSSYRITLLRRFFMRFAKIVSDKHKYKFVITGDSLGQVASQTPESMTMIDNATEQLIVRPLVSSSKNEIINIAEEIGTYEISIRPGDDMCSAFTPRNPIIFPKKYVIQKLEEELGDMEELLFSVLREDTRVVELKDL